MNTLICLPLISIYLYSCINNYLNKFISNPHYNIRIISSIHCFFCVMISSIFLLNLIDNNFYLNSIYLISPGYFILDFFYLIFFSPQSKLTYCYYFHHIISLTGIYFGIDYPIYLARGLLTELSTPFLNISWYLKKKKYTKYIIYHINLIILYILFFICRIVNLSIMIFEIEHYHLLYRCIIYFFTILNYIWFISISKIMYIEFN